MNNILEIKNLNIDYGIVKAVKGINMSVPKGSIVAILGANGAGKTSTIRSLSGLTRISGGEVVYNGENITNLAPHKITKKGVVQSPEGRLIFAGLTVEENLLAGAYSIKKQKIVDKETGEINKTSRSKIVSELLNDVYNYFPILKERRKQQATTLSGGEQQMLAIGRALMGKPELLLLDEPSLGLAPLIIKDIFEIIKKIRDDGRTILIVEQNAKQTLKIADYAYVLEVGKIAKEGIAKDLLKDESLVQAYLG